jgi:hypothetical protein
MQKALFDGGGPPRANKKQKYKENRETTFQKNVIF